MVIGRITQQECNSFANVETPQRCHLSHGNGRIYRAAHHFTPFKYQLSPSLPVKKDGPGKAIIVILSALIGGMVACGGVLLRYAMASRKQDAMMADHLV